MKTIIILCTYYLAPIFANNLVLLILLLLVVNPILCFLLAYTHAKENKISFKYSLLLGLLFIPSIFIYYNYTAYVYAIFYTMVAYIGSFIGSVVANRKIDLE